MVKSIGDSYLKFSIVLYIELRQISTEDGIVKKGNSDFARERICVQ